MADFEVGFVNVCEKFGIRALNDYQREAITQFVNKKTDLFINLHTGYGKLQFDCNGTQLGRVHIT